MIEGTLVEIIVCGYFPSEFGLDLLYLLFKVVVLCARLLAHLIELFTSHNFYSGPARLLQGLILRYLLLRRLPLAAELGSGSSCTVAL